MVLLNECGVDKCSDIRMNSYLYHSVCKDWYIQHSFNRSLRKQWKEFRIAKYALKHFEWQCHVCVSIELYCMFAYAYIYSYQNSYFKNTLWCMYVNSSPHPHPQPQPQCRIYAPVNPVSIGSDNLNQYCNIVDWILSNKIIEIVIKFHTFSFKKMHLKISPAKWRPFCTGGDDLIHWSRVIR